MTTLDDPEESLRNETIAGNVKAVLYLLSLGANPNCQNVLTGWTPLHYAAKYGQKEAANVLLRHFADSQLPAKDGTLPYQLAAAPELRQLLGAPAEPQPPPPPAASPRPIDFGSLRRRDSRRPSNESRPSSWKASSLSSSSTSSLRTFRVEEPVHDSVFGKSPGAKPSAIELELLVFSGQREDDQLMGAIFVRASDAVSTIRDRVAEEIDTAPPQFAIARHNGARIVPITKRQLEQPIATHFRDDDVVIVTAATSVTQNVLETAQASATAGIAAISSLISRNGVKPDHLIKLFIVGDSGVGKSCLLLRFAEDAFYSAFVSTIGIDYKCRTIEVDGKAVKLEVWDTAGQERFRTITTDVRTWYTDVRLNGEENANVVIVGNKCDEELLRAVSRDEGQALADELGVRFFEASAKSNVSVNDMFVALTRDVLSRVRAEREALNDPFPLEATQEGISLEALQRRLRDSGGCCGGSPSPSVR